MTVRTFLDSNGITWTVWDVHPQWAERRVAERRQGTLGPPPHIAALFGDRRRRTLRQGRRGGAAPRLGVELRVPVHPGYSHGWLAFTAPSGERRRLAPIPDSWDALSDHELRELCARAEPAGNRRHPTS